MIDWISCEEVAAIAGISARKARQALNRASDGKAWRDHTLDVRTLQGRGGKSGLQYVVKVSTLPVDLQERLKALQTAGEAVSNLRFGDAAQLERNWKYDVIKAALEHPKGTAERAAEIDRLHGTERLDWTGH
jgi:MarR-like DNA-binding transcriptional regulator SgrR of sgrS sRNA